MRLRYAVPAGLLDAGFASLATLAVGVYAARTLTASELGAYALFFAAFLMATVVPTQLVLVPAEFATLPSERVQRLGLLRQTWRLGPPTAVVAAIVAVGAAYIGAEGPHSLRWALAVSTTAAAVVSPLQDHVRRILHLAGVSWRAASVSAAQLVSVGAFLGLFEVAGVPASWRPFGALALANLASISVGLALARHEVCAFTVPRSPMRDLVRSGRWLLLLEFVTTGALFLSSVVITRVTSPATLGHAEAARIVAQPIFVLAVGLNAVLAPRSIEAAAAGDRVNANRILRPFLMLLAATGALYGAYTASPWWGNPLSALVPQAYAIPGLVLVTVLAQILTNGGATIRSELIGGRYEWVLPRVAVAASVPQCLAATSAIWIGAFARPLGIALFGVVLLIGYQRYRQAMYRRGPDLDRGPMTIRP
jgi:O-antigen/teichoic acid export membrane protein